MTRWIPRPDRPPHRCAVTLRGQDETGPFLDLGLDYFAPVNEGGKLGVSPHLQRLYLCARAIKEACEKPGSPFVVLGQEEHRSLLAQIAAMRRQVDGLRSDLAAEKEREPAPPVDVQALADALIVSLDERYRRKPGPRPAGRAA